MALVSGTDVSSDEGADMVKDRSCGGDCGACALSHDISNFFENLVVNKLGKSSSVLSHLGEELVQVSELLVQCHKILLLLIDLSFGLFVLLLRSFLLLFDRISFPVKSVSSLAEALDALIQVDKLILHLSEILLTLTHATLGLFQDVVANLALRDPVSEFSSGLEVKGLAFDEVSIGLELESLSPRLDWLVV